MQSITNEIFKLVGNDNLMGAIDKLKIILKDSPKLDEVILHSARISDLMKQIRNGQLRQNDIEVNKNNIRMAIIDLAREIDQEIENNPSLLETEQSSQNSSTTNNIRHSGDGDIVMRDKNITNNNVKG